MSSAMFSGRETANSSVEKLFVQIFEKKRRIVEQVKQQVDLQDQLLLSKCLLAGVPPPPWLWSTSLLSQTSEFNKEEIITGLLFPHSRPSIIFPTSLFSYELPPSFLNDNVVRQQDLPLVVNSPLEEQFLECDLSHKKDANSASRQNVHEEEGVPESVSVSCRENQSCLSPKYSQTEKFGNSHDHATTSPGFCQGKPVSKSVSTTGCEQKPPFPLYCQDETEPGAGLQLAKIQRSKSRQKAFELRSSAKASKSRSSSRKELKPSPMGSSLGIASLISDSVDEIKLSKHDGNEEGHQDKVENSNSQGEREDQSIKFSSTASTTNSSSPHQKVDMVQIISSGDAYVVQESVVESGHVKEMDRNGLMVEMVIETEPRASHTGLKEREDKPPESNTITGHIDTVAKRNRCEIFSVKHVSPISINIACAEKNESHCQESSILEFCCSSAKGSSQLQNKRRRTLEKLTSRVLSSSSEGDILDSDSVRETVYDMEEATRHNLDHYNGELQKMIGSASADPYAVELQKLMGSASSDELRFQECYLFKEAGLMSPALLSFAIEQLSIKRSQTTPDHKLGSEDTNFLPCAGETSHPLASCVVQDSDSSPVLEGFIISNDDENQTGSQSQIYHDSFQLPRTSGESAALMEQICKSSRMTTPSFHLTKTFNFAGKMDVDQSVSTVLLDDMYLTHNLEGSSVFDKLYSDCLPTTGAGSSADAKKNLCTSPADKLWYRNLPKSSSSEKQVSQTPGLPCISEENENINEAEHLCTTTPTSVSSEKLGVSIPDLPSIAEENGYMDEISEAVNEPSDTARENAFVERKPLGNFNENAMKFLPTVSDAMIHFDRQSLDSISTAFSLSAKCDSVKSKVRKQNGGKRRFTGKGKENQGGVGAGRNVKPPSSRVGKLKSSCNSSLKTVGPRLPLVQQQKPAAPLITGKRDVKVKALEAAEASKRIAEQKENDRKMKKEAMKLERARQEQENLRKQEIEKKKKEEDRKKKEAEMAWKQEMEKKRKEEERKRKEFEMADRKRKREEEDKKLKEARRQRIAEIQRQSKDARLKAHKGVKEDQTNAEKNQGQTDTRIPEVRPESNCSDGTNASRNSRDDDFKVISNQGKMFEESYDISPYKCSDDEEEEEDEDDDHNISNHKFVPTWARKERVLLSVISQQNLDPYIIFSAEGFCDIRKIVLPRKFQWR